MIDKLYLVSTRCVIIYYSHKPPVTVVSDAGNALALALLILTPSSLSLKEYSRALVTSQEDTVSSYQMHTQGAA